MSRDVKAPDGLVAHGLRWVRRGGAVKFAHVWWQSDKLLPFVGREVTVYAGDYHYQEIDVFDGLNFICKIKA